MSELTIINETQYPLIMDGKHDSATGEITVTIKSKALENLPKCTAEITPLGDEMTPEKAREIEPHFDYLDFNGKCVFFNAGSYYTAIELEAIACLMREKEAKGESI